MRTLPWTWWSAVLGFALGGFFDGILLHQILQWHHLLSLVPGVADLRSQILWDGYFHALMYLIAAVAVWGLWRTHARAGDAPGWPLFGALAIGFGLWHVVDSVLSHWLLGIHRIRVDSPNPLLWDLIWFVAFGVLPLSLGWWLRRGPPRAPPAARSVVPLVLVTAVTLAAGAWSLRPPGDQPFTTVVFPSGRGVPQVFAALVALDARLVWADAAMGVVVVDVAAAQRWRFYGRGALLVSGTGLGAGCLNWSRI